MGSDLFLEPTKFYVFIYLFSHFSGSGVIALCYCFARLYNHHVHAKHSKSQLSNTSKSKLTLIVGKVAYVALTQYVHGMPPDVIYSFDTCLFGAVLDIEKKNAKNKNCINPYKY